MLHNIQYTILIHPLTLHNRLSPSELKVRLGEWDVGSDTEFYRHEERDVSGLYSHPDFYSGNLNNDIAVIKVHRSIDLTTK